MGEVVRDNKGRFIKGRSGNPLGKAKGIRNQMTLERVAFEKALRDYVADPMRAHKLLKGIDRVLDVAINAEKDSDATAALKLMLDRVMPALPRLTTPNHHSNQPKRHIPGRSCYRR
jgi:hypothetical protein